MATANGLDIAAFGIACVGFSLLVLWRGGRVDLRSLDWRRPGRVATRTGIGIGLLAGVLALLAWGFAGLVANVLGQANQGAADTPGLAFLYFWLGIGVAHAPLAGLTVFRSTRRFGSSVAAGVLAGSLFAVGTAVGVMLLISGLPSMRGTPPDAGGAVLVAALFSAVLLVGWVLPSALLAALGCVAAMLFYPAWMGP